MCSIQWHQKWHLQPVAAISVSSSGLALVSIKQKNDDGFSDLRVLAQETSSCAAAKLFLCSTLSANFQDHVNDRIQSCLASDLHESSMDHRCDIVARSATEEHESLRSSGICSNYVAAPHMCNTRSCLAADVHYKLCTGSRYDADVYFTQRNPPGITSWQIPSRELSYCVAAELFFCRAAEHFQLSLLQHYEYGDKQKQSKQMALVKMYGTMHTRNPSSSCVELISRPLAL